MKKMIIFEAAMCCATGVCGPSVDSELLRVTTILNNLKNNGIEIKRYNLTNDPMKFIDNKVINKVINEGGVDSLPAIIVDDEVVIIKRYPTNEEYMSLLNITEDKLKSKASFGLNVTGQNSGADHV